MKLLWLGTSQDVDGFLPEEQRAPAGVGRRLGELLETDVTVDVRYIWPNERLPALVGSWLESVAPDMVYIDVSPYWCCFESVPLKLQRRFGKVGKPVASAGLKAAETNWVASSRLYYAARDFALWAVGGATHFEPEEVVECMKTCISLILDADEPALLLQGLHGMDPHYTLRRRRSWAEARRRLVDRTLAEFCRTLPVVYNGFGDQSASTSDPGTRMGDRLHLTPAGHEAVVGELVPRFLQAWQARRPAAVDG